MTEIIIAVLAIAVGILAREYLVERQWRMDVEAEVDEWRRKDREQWIAVEQAKDDAEYLADWGGK